MTRKRCLWTGGGHRCPLPAIAVIGLRVPPHEPGSWAPRCANHLIDKTHRYNGEELVIHWYDQADHAAHSIPHQEAHSA